MVPYKNEVLNNSRARNEYLPLRPAARLHDIPQVALHGASWRDLGRGKRAHRAGGGVVRVRHNFSGGNVVTEHDTIEDLVCRLGLVVGYLVASLEDTREGEVAVLADDSSDVRRVCLDVVVSRAAEVGGSLGLYRQADLFTTEPYPGIVSKSS